MAFHDRLQHLIPATHDQPTVAKTLKVSPSYLNQILTGNRIPGPDFIASVAQAFNADENLLLLSAGYLPERYSKAVQNNPEETLEFLRKMPELRIRVTKDQGPQPFQGFDQKLQWKSWLRDRLWDLLHGYDPKVWVSKKKQAPWNNTATQIFVLQDYQPYKHGKLYLTKKGSTMSFGYWVEKGLSDDRGMVPSNPAYKLTHDWTWLKVLKKIEHGVFTIPEGFTLEAVGTPGPLQATWKNFPKQGLAIDAAKAALGTLENWPHDIWCDLTLGQECSLPTSDPQIRLSAGPVNEEQLLDRIYTTWSLVQHLL